ncbi:MAG: class I SAM-dependent methyltransferase [Comamonadaceae bacterium]|nr:MAG: class I SAM-dependent methyltransferase [Comamonadaceae bacterium]
MDAVLDPYLKPGVSLVRKSNYYEAPIPSNTLAIQANAYYFSQPEWAQEYLQYCHRSEHFKNRWMKATGPWDDKIVLDVGCGPGNVHATLGCRARLLIGVDVAAGSLELAARQGYVAVLADACHLPFRSGFADLVLVNASLHHCDDMNAVLTEAARAVRPGGLLVTDHDPQRSAWDFRGAAKLLWDARLLIYRITGHSFHKSGRQQASGLRTEIHHRPGDGVTREFFTSVLGPLGFAVQVFPHNHELGAEVLDGKMGRAEFKYRMGNLLSGRHPDAAESALSLMCVARRDTGRHATMGTLN